MSAKNKLLILLLVLLVPMMTAAVYLFKTLDAKDGLTSSQVNCIVKDSKGYVWFGTPAGLYRYDGYSFKSFQCNSQDGSSLPDSYIINIQEALDNSLWIETATGFCVYHPQSETFERDMHQVYARMGISDTPTIVYFDKFKNLWLYVPQKGIIAYNMQQQLIYEFGYMEGSQGIPHGKVCSISECRDGALIVYEDGTLACCDIMHQQRVVWKNQEIANKGLRHTPTLRAFADQTDNIWLYGQGTLMCLNKKAAIWETTLGDSLGLVNDHVDRSVTGMAADKIGNIWISTDHDGLLKAHVNTHRMERVEPKSMNGNQQHIVSVQTVYVDNTDLLWVGTERNGVAFYGNNIYRFDAKPLGDITAIAEDVNGRLWYGTSDRGIVGYNGPLSGQRISSMASTADGSVWVGTKRNGLTRIRPDGTTTCYTANDSSRTLINNQVTSLCTDKSGNLWIATAGGLQVYSLRMNNFSSYTKENGRLHTNNVTSLCCGRNNRMLAGTDQGLLELNLSTIEKTVLIGNSTNMKTFTNNYITQVFEDSRGIIWVGTREGLNILSNNNDSLNYLTEKNGICNNNICGIVEDKNHNIWVSTSNGVSRVVVQRDHERGSFNFGLYNYDTSDGLQGHEFNKGAILATADGRVVFGGLYGVNVTRKLGKNDTGGLPRVMLTQLIVDGKEIQIGHEYDGNIILSQALNESREIVLNNNQNTFSIKFAAGNYNQSERLQFAYLMEGLHHDWRNGNALSHGVDFERLSSGTYTLHVKAVGADGSASNQVRQLKITILPPWWLSWWMILIYVVSALLIGYSWHFGMKRQAYVWKKKKAVINELMMQKEEIKAASDDLRQPMARMASIIGNITEMPTTSIESKEQLNALHFQMLQIITRISEMQTVLENPEQKAKSTASDRLQLNDNGMVSIAEMTEGELTSEIRTHRTDLPTQKYTVAFVDDNPRFLKFVEKYLSNIYDLHTYNDIETVASDLLVLSADVLVCKQNMPMMTGSELCNQLKLNHNTHQTKFILMTDGVLTPQDMEGMNITLAADDYLAKPFSMQDAVMRINRILGLAPTESLPDVLEGGATRMLEGRNASMTTATESYDGDGINLLSDSGPDNTAKLDAPSDSAGKLDSDSSMTAVKQPGGVSEETKQVMERYYGQDGTIGSYSMSDIMDQQLIRNVEQYVVQNMSRGQISLEDMALAMGMGRVPFFHKIRNITSKTPAELVRDLRLKHACTLLERTNINMSELAINVGFMTAENFIHIFKEKFGMTPLEYRLKNKKV